MKIESKFDYLDTAYFVFNNKIQKLEVIEINFGVARSPGPYNTNLFKHHSVLYAFRKERYNADDYIFTDDKGKVLWLEEHKVFKTKEELLEYLSKTVI